MSNNVLETDRPEFNLKLSHMKKEQQKELKAKIARLKESGLTIDEISRKCNISASAVNRLRRNGKNAGTKKARSGATVESVYAYIKSYILLHLYAPSYGEIAEELQMSKSTVKEYMDELFERGLIETDTGNKMGNYPRAFRLCGYRMQARA